MATTFLKLQVLSVSRREFCSPFNSIPRSFVTKEKLLVSAERMLDLETSRVLKRGLKFSTGSHRYNFITILHSSQQVLSFFSLLVIINFVINFLFTIICVNLVLLVLKEVVTSVKLEATIFLHSYSHHFLLKTPLDSDSYILSHETFLRLISIFSISKSHYFSLCQDSRQNFVTISSN